MIVQIAQHIPLSYSSWPPSKRKCGEAYSIAKFYFDIVATHTVSLGSPLACTYNDLCARAKVICCTLAGDEATVESE